MTFEFKCSSALAKWKQTKMKNLIKLYITALKTSFDFHQRDEMTSEIYSDVIEDMKKKRHSLSLPHMQTHIKETKTTALEQLIGGLLKCQKKSSKYGETRVGVLLKSEFL